MHISIPTPDNLKEKAKLARLFLKEKCGTDVPHSKCIEMISQLFGFKDWNTANAELPKYAEYERVMGQASLRSGTREIQEDVQGLNLGDLREALKNYPDSTKVDVDYGFNLGEFLNSIDELQSPEDDIDQEFAITAVDEVDKDFVSLKLTLKYESYSTPR